MDEDGQYLRALDDEIVASAGLMHRRARPPVVRRDAAGATVLRHLLAPQEPGNPEVYVMAREATDERTRFGQSLGVSVKLTDAEKVSFTGSQGREVIDVDTTDDVSSEQDASVIKSRR